MIITLTNIMRTDLHQKACDADQRAFIKKLAIQIQSLLGIRPVEDKDRNGYFFRCPEIYRLPHNCNVDKEAATAENCFACEEEEEVEEEES